jgi:cell division protein ZapA
MGQISVTLNGRTYRLRCGEGEEERLLELANHVSARVDGLAAEFGQVGDDRLLLMAALLITDELWDAREQLEVRNREASEVVTSPLDEAALAPEAVRREPDRRAVRRTGP